MVSMLETSTPQMTTVVPEQLPYISEEEPMYHGNQSQSTVDHVSLTSLVQKICKAVKLHITCTHPTISLCSPTATTYNVLSNPNVFADDATNDTAGTTV